MALDLTSRKAIWQNPSSRPERRSGSGPRPSPRPISSRAAEHGSNRTAPNIAEAYDGLVYGTTANGPVVLNARTGEDVNDSPGVVPIVTDPDAGIGEGENNELESYLATG